MNWQSLNERVAMASIQENEHGVPSALGIAVCQQVQEGRDDCWQRLVQGLMQELAANQNQLQQAIAHNQHLETQCKRLEENLLESEAKNHALMEASTAQAQQFSETLRQLRQNQSKIVQSEKMASLGQLVAGVAHEINNPVNFIYGNLTHATEYTQEFVRLLQLYQQHYPEPTPEIAAAATAIDIDFLMADLPKLLASMRVGAERIQKIVMSLRNFSRMDEAEMKAVDIHEGIESTLMILQNRLKAKSDQAEIHIVKEYSNLPRVECYAGQLNQVFMNVLVNAIDALEERDCGTRGTQCQVPGRKDAQATGPNAQSTAPCIRIRTETLGSDRVQIRIADNGSGIPENIQRQIFDPFFTTKPVGKGTGMGMSISYQIITEKHGGTLEFVSTPGQGTEFIIQIPIRQKGQVEAA
ncbi:hypothetical protein J5X98_00335 [Leptothermofonsia sichuanensis E412]|nr:hypothetical protein J5X98_00335 [Leptothermofonsia sichuanensis E412]